MKTIYNYLLPIVIALSLTLLILIQGKSFLTFSDTAKYADIARNIVEKSSYSHNFTFFSGLKTIDKIDGNWFADWPPPVTPLLIGISYIFFGISDYSVMATTLVFYSLTLLLVWALAKKYFGELAAVLSMLAVGLNNDIAAYSLSGGTEIIFMAESLLGFYLLSFKNKIANFAAIIVVILMYFTRAHYFIFGIGMLITYLFTNYEYKRALILALLWSVVFVITDCFVLSILNGRWFFYSISGFGSYGLSSGTNSVSASDQLRGTVSQVDYFAVIKKVLYNFYNFYKALPVIASPYIWALFGIGLFSWSKNKVKNLFKISVLFIVFVTFFVTALTIPFYRYIHPIVPFVYIIGIATLVDIIDYFVSSWNVKNKKNFVALTSSLLVLFFAIGQTLGIIFLDSRFEKKLKNTDKAPIYVDMAYKLKDVTNKDAVIVTNLDTWGSWYGERKTIWFPLEPNMILPVQDNIDAIYLTSYKVDDENYYMGESWREIFESPEKQTILPDFKFVGKYEFKAENNYERENGRAVLLERK